MPKHFSFPNFPELQGNIEKIMEKKKYVKPEININEFKSSISFLATSGQIFDTEEEIDQLVNILDGCFRLKNGKNSSVTNADLKTYMSTHSSVCITVGAPEGDEVCDYGYTTEDQGYKLTYDSSTDAFTLTRDTSCDGDAILNIGSSSW